MIMMMIIMIKATYQCSGDDDDDHDDHDDHDHDDEVN